MPGRGPQTFKKRQKEQQRKEKQQEKMAKRLARKDGSASTSTEEQEAGHENDPTLTSSDVELESPENGTEVQ
jgi:hypothetical protein